MAHKAARAQVKHTAHDIGDQESSGATHAIVTRMRHFNKELDRLMRLQFSSNAPLVDFIKEINRAASRMLGVARSSVWIYTEDRSAILCHDLYNADEAAHSDGALLQEDEHPVYFKALAARRVIDAPDAQSDPCTREFADSYLRPLNIVSMIDAQIPSASCVRGVICCETVGGRREWTPDEASFIASLAGLLGNAFEYDERAKILTELERRSQQVEEQSAELSKLALVAQHTEDIVVICDNQRFIEWVNPAFTRLTGYSLDEVRGTIPGKFVQGPQTDPVTTKNIAIALAESKPIRTEILNYAKSGRAYWLELQINPIVNNAGEIERYIAVERDVTARKENDEKLAAALRAAEQASAAKSAFLATMSHEIRTPMNGVLGMAAALEKTDLSSSQGRMVGVIRDAGDMLLNVLNDVLDFSRIEAGEISIEKAPFHIDEILRKIESLHALKARERGVEFTTRGREELYAPRIGDQTRLLQILHNLVGNAIKFTEQGEIIVACSEREAANGESEVVFEVKDSGIGMTPEQLSRVFDRFQQADDSTTRRYGGTGLGLSIVKGLVDALGGCIEVESKEHVGSVFRVILPLPLAETSAATNDEPRQDISAAAEACANLSILAAEDNAINRLVLQTILEPIGIKISFATNGREAVDAFSGNQFDAVLMDIQMPVMDGEEALAEIRRVESELGRDPVPVIAVTANAMDHHVERYTALGFSGYVSKPVNAEAVCSAIQDCLNAPSNACAGKSLAAQ